MQESLNKGPEYLWYSPPSPLKKIDLPISWLWPKKWPLMWNWLLLSQNFGPSRFELFFCSDCGSSHFRLGYLSMSELEMLEVESVTFVRKSRCIPDCSGFLSGGQGAGEGKRWVCLIPCLAVFSMLESKQQGKWLGLFSSFNNTFFWNL